MRNQGFTHSANSQSDPGVEGSNPFGAIYPILSVNTERFKNQNSQSFIIGELLK